VVKNETARCQKLQDTEEMGEKKTRRHSLTKGKKKVSEKSKKGVQKLNLGGCVGVGGVGGCNLAGGLELKNGRGEIL